MVNALFDVLPKLPTFRSRYEKLQGMLIQYLEEEEEKKHPILSTNFE